jgi:hypothetical protein
MTSVAFDIAIYIIKISKKFFKKDLIFSKICATIEKVFLKDVLCLFLKVI